MHTQTLIITGMPRSGTSRVADLLQRIVRRWRRASAAQRTPRTAAARLADAPHGVVLFVSHDAHRHGAQLLLLHLLRWIRANTNLAFEIILKGDGELRADFEAVAPTHRWPAALRTSAALQDPARIGLVYSNTITNGDLLGELMPLMSPACPVVTHVHELEHWIHHHVDPRHLRSVVERTSHYIAVSRRVRQALIESVRVPPERIDLVYEFVGPEALRPPDGDGARRLRRTLGIPDDAAIVGGSGTMDWRKGPDLFVQAAAAVRRLDASGPVHFVWVGGAQAGPAYEQLRYDARHAGVADAVHFVGSVADPMRYYALCDVFALVSREDPFPLVALEAAAHGVPIVCFDQAGGCPELLAEGCGEVVPFLDIYALAERVVALLRSPERRHALGSRGAAVVRERYTVDVIAPAIVALIGRVLSGPAQRSVAR